MPKPFKVVARCHPADPNPSHPQPMFSILGSVDRPLGPQVVREVDDFAALEPLAAEVASGYAYQCCVLLTVHTSCRKPRGFVPAAETVSRVLRNVGAPGLS